MNQEIVDKAIFDTAALASQAAINSGLAADRTQQVQDTLAAQLLINAAALLDVKNTLAAANATAAINVLEVKNTLNSIDVIRMTQSDAVKNTLVTTEATKATALAAVATALATADATRAQAELDENNFVGTLFQNVVGVQASVLVKSAPARLCKIIVNQSQPNVSIELRHGTTSGGVLIGILSGDTTKAVEYELNLPNGLWVKTLGTQADFTIIYK